MSNSNSKVGKVQEPLRSNGSRQITPSRTRAKTVSFSNNGYSEEICKVRHHLRRMAAQEFNEESSPVSQPPPGFEFESQKYDSHTQAVDQAPREVELIEESGELNNSPIIANVQPRHGFVTPSGISEQDQQVTANVDDRINDKRALLQGPLSSTYTEATSESLKQLAHESLQIGEILGIRVIGDYEAAVSRITKPLKKNKGKKRSTTKGRPE